MSSSFAQRFHHQARPLLWREHGETIVAIAPDGTRSDVQVTWQRRDPQSEDHDGLGVDTYYAVAAAVVRVADLPAPDGRMEFEREGERWSLRLIERQDEWTWIFHLAHPRDDIRLPGSLR